MVQFDLEKAKQGEPVIILWRGEPLDCTLDFVEDEIYAAFDIHHIKLSDYWIKEYLRMK